MNRHDIEKIVREQRNREEIEGLPFKILGSIAGTLIYHLRKMDGIAWLFLLTLIQSAYFSYLLKSGLAFLIMFVLLVLCFYFMPYFLSVIFPTALISIMVILSLPTPSLVGPTAPTFSNYLAGIFEAFWLWLGLIVASLYAVYRTQRY